MLHQWRDFCLANIEKTILELFEKPLGFTFSLGFFYNYLTLVISGANVLPGLRDQRAALEETFILNNAEPCLYDCTLEGGERASVSKSHQY
jgi:hypothetical protein